jgi:hypothetical protein
MPSEIQSSLTSPKNGVKSAVFLTSVDTIIRLVETGDSTAANATIMTKAFDTLSGYINFAELSTEMGLSTRLTSSSIDFNGVVLGYNANNNNPFAEVLCANFKQNSPTDSVFYGFAWISDTASFTSGQQFMVKLALNKYFTLYDLTYGYEYTITNYNDSATWKTTEKQGSYIYAAMNVVRGGVNPLVSGGCSGQNVVNCITDAYSNHGWVSVWLFVQTAYLPVTAAAVAGSCAAINCISHKD